MSLLLAFALAAAPAQAAPKRNIVFVDICSARADRFGFEGAKPVLTPRLDAFAKEGMTFANALAQASWCLPNYASLFTGHRPETHGLYRNIPGQGLPAFETTLAQRLKDAGYATGAFTAGVYFLPAWGLTQGFDVFENHFSTAHAHPGSFEETMPRALAWIEDQKDPFFLYLTVDDLHAPYTVDPADAALSSAAASVARMRAHNRGDAPATRAELEAVGARYDASMKRVDRLVGEFLERLKASGKIDDTIVVLTADHGEALGDNGLLGHTEGLYDSVLRVPLLVRHPDYADLRGRRFDELVERVDLTPTALDFGGAPYDPDALHGRSLKPFLDDPSAPRRRYATAGQKRNIPEGAHDAQLDERVIRDARWKLHWYAHKDGFELYDLKKDPGETKNVAKKHPDIVSRLAFELFKRVEKERPKTPGPSDPAGVTQKGHTFVPDPR